MPSYFATGQSWASLNRSERAFCAALYRHDLARPGSLAAAIGLHCKAPPQRGTKWDWNSAPVIAVPKADAWETALEACFFRDMYRAKPTATKPKNFNALAQTTFDLVLFSDDAIIVIEAKGIESFSTAQLRRIAGIKSGMSALVGNSVQVLFYGLISSKYLRNISNRPAAGELYQLDGLVAWRDLAAFYEACPLLAQADAVYGT